MRLLTLAVNPDIAGYDGSNGGRNWIVHIIRWTTISFPCTADLYTSAEVCSPANLAQQKTIFINLFDKIRNTHVFDMLFNSIVLTRTKEIKATRVHNISVMDHRSFKTGMVGQDSTLLTGARDTWAPKIQVWTLNILKFLQRTHKYRI